jgi:hypothetical protein
LGISGPIPARGEGNRADHVVNADIVIPSVNRGKNGHILDARDVDGAINAGHGTGLIFDPDELLFDQEFGLFFRFKS